MAKFRFRADIQFVQWSASIYEIEANSKEEALKKLEENDFAIFSMEANNDAELIESGLPSDDLQYELCQDDRVILTDEDSGEEIFDGYI